MNGLNVTRYLQRFHMTLQIYIIKLICHSITNIFFENVQYSHSLLLLLSSI